VSVKIEELRDFGAHRIYNDHGDSLVLDDLALLELVPKIESYIRTLPTTTWVRVAMAGREKGVNLP